MEVFCRYIPIVSLTDVLCRYIPTDFERELCPSVKISDEKISQVILLVFSNFLVVVEVDYHFVRDRVAKKEIQIRFISSHDQLANVVIKPLPTAPFITFRFKLQVNHPLSA